MRYIDENFNDINESNIDLSKGYLISAKIIKKEATPIDNISKFAWCDDDYEDAEMYCLGTIIETTEQDETDAMLVDHEYRLTLLELGI